MLHIIDHRNCTSFHLLITTQEHTQVETLVLSLFLTYILLSNLFVVTVTIGSAQLRGCLFSMQLAASYVGNIIAGTSLFANDIYHSAVGIPPICQSGKDGYVFLYFGLSMNMIILVLNTKYRYDGIANIRNRNIPNAIRTKDVVCKAWLPALLASGVLTTVAMLVQVFVVDYQYLISIGICLLPMTFSIVWNILLGRSLKKGRKNSMILKRKESTAVLDRATFIINVTIVVYFASLVVSVVAVVCSLFYLSTEVVIGISWLLRVFSLCLFTVEGHVYLSKVGVAREVVKRKFVQCFRREKVLGPGAWTHADDDDDDELTLTTSNA